MPSRVKKEVQSLCAGQEAIALGWRPLLLGWRPRLEAITIRNKEKRKGLKFCAAKFNSAVGVFHSEFGLSNGESMAW